MRHLHARRNRKSRSHVESLEARQLLTGTVEINTTTHVLSYSAQTGFSNAITVQVLPGTPKLLQISDGGSDDISLGANAQAAGWTTSLDAHTVSGPETSFNSFSVDTKDGSDQLFLISIDAPVTFSPTNAGSDEVEIGGAPGDKGLSENVTGQVTLHNTTGTIQLTVNDAGDAVARQVQINDGQISGLTPQPILYGNGIVNSVLVSTGDTPNTVDFTNNMLALSTVIEDGADDTVNVHATAAGSNLLIEGISGGHDTVNITQAGSLHSILGPITLDSTDEFPAVTIDGSADTTAMNVAINDDGTITGLAPATINLGAQTTVKLLTIKAGTGGNTIAFKRVADALDPPTVVDINSGSGNDTVNINTNPATNTVNVDTQAGTGTVQLGLTNAAAGVLGPVNILSTGGTTTVSVDDESDNGLHSVALTDTSLVGLAGGNITFNHPQSVSIIGSGDAGGMVLGVGDSFTVTPSATTSFSIDGGPFLGAQPLDKLTVLTAGTVPTLTETSTVNGLQGSYTFPTRMQVTFARIGTLLGSLTGVVFSKLTGAPVINAPLFLDLNGNATKDDSDPATTTDSTGHYSFLGIAAGQYQVIQTADSATTVVSPLPVTIAEGQETEASAIVDAPPTDPNGPDLTATITVLPPAIVVGGAKGKAKVKITNSGAATAVGTPKIALFASADGMVDPSATEIGEFPAGKINLKQGKSKTVSIAFFYPTTLPTGGYFILATADSSNVITESNESNNSTVGVSATQITAPFIDLAGTFAHLPKALKAGKAAAIPLTIENIGNTIATGTIGVDLFASADQTLDNADQQLLTQAPVTIKIKPGKSKTVKLRLLTGSTVAGSNYFIADINSTQAIVESSIANNVVVSAAVVPVV